MRTKVISRIFHAYGTILETLRTLQQDRDVHDEIGGLHKQAMKWRNCLLASLL